MCNLRLLLACVVALGLSWAEAAAEEEAPWIDARHVRPFVCRANFELAGHEPLFRDLEQLERDVAGVLRLKTSGEIVELYLFDSRSAYRDYLQSRFPSVPFRRALFIKHGGPGMVYAYQTRDLPVDVRHEATHALLHTALPNVPLWLDEGLAEYFEVRPDERAYDHPHLSGVRWSLWSNVSPLAELEAKQELSEMGRKEYREAWAWVHFCLHGPPEVRRQFALYLADLAAQRPTAPLSDRLGRILAEPEAQLVLHFKHWKRPAGTAATP